MTGATHWQLLRDELARRQNAGSMVRMWLRDDDAVASTEALDRLVGLTGKFTVPVAIAAIPARTDRTLAQHLADVHHATLVAHGWNHENHAPPWQKKEELGGHRPVSQVVSDLAEAHRCMVQLHGKKYLPMLVPPWNRISAEVLPYLPSLGFTAISCFGTTRLNAPMPVFNAHLDLIDWHGTRGSRDHAALIDDLLEQLRRAQQTAEAVGILSHHLAHDGAAWAFLETLFALTGSFSCCRWESAGELMQQEQKY